MSVDGVIDRVEGLLIEIAKSTPSVERPDPSRRQAVRPITLMPGRYAEGAMLITALAASQRASRWPRPMGCYLRYLCVK